MVSRGNDHPKGASYTWASVARGELGGVLPIGVLQGPLEGWPGR